MGMIHIDGDYYIRPDDYCYALVRRYMSTVQKTGEKVEAFDALTYHGSIAGCIKSYTRIALRNRIAASPDIELSELLTMIREAEAETERLIEKATGGR